VVNAGRYEVLPFEVDGRQRRAAVWLPPGFDPHREWPLLVYLHGYGERGDAMEHVPVGLGRTLAAHPERYPGIVLMPQCPTDLVWVVVDQPWAVGHGSAESHVDAALEAALGQLPIDRRRIALTGLSMGGFGTFVYGAPRAERFCAFLAVCGGGRAEDAARFVGRPFRVFHGDADDVVSVELSRQMVAAMRDAGAREELHYVEYPGVGHVSWDLAYGDPEAAAFLFSHRLSDSPAD
jgi:predicted peptidase